MTDIDEAIKQALEAEDSELLGKLEEGSFTQTVVQTFRGRWRFLVVLSWVMTALFTVPMFLSAYRFWVADQTRDQLLWGAAFFFCGMAVALHKLFYWIELARTSLIREIKRLELQVADLRARASSR